MMGLMALNRAHNATGIAIGEAHLNNQLKTFNELRHAVALANSLSEVQFKATAPQALLEFREKFLSLGDSIFSSEPYAAATSAYLQTLVPFSVLDAIKVHALVLSKLFPQSILGTGFVADTTSEGAPKAIRMPSLQAILGPIKKTASIALWSDLLDAVVELKALIQRMQNSSLVRGQNAAVFDVLMAHSPTPVAAATSGNALTDLEALLAALPAGAGIVVAASWATVRRLALSPARGPSFTAFGGEFVAGVSVVATDDMPPGTAMVGVEASRCALFDGGLRLAPARHATVEISDAPGTPNASTVMTSLWQQGLRALLAERIFQLAVPEDAVAIITG